DQGHRGVHRQPPDRDVVHPRRAHEHGRHRGTHDRGAHGRALPRGGLHGVGALRQHLPGHVRPGAAPRARRGRRLRGGRPRDDRRHPHGLGLRMSTGAVTVIEYLEPVVEAEALPEEFSPSSLRRSLLILGAIVLGVVALIVLVPGLGSLRARFMGAQPEWIAVAALLQLGSCAGYVLVFRGVFCRRMSWRTSTEIGLSELAANSVLSVGGAGGLALGAWILRRGGLPTAFIARRTVAFFLLTILANVGFLAIGGIGLATGLLHGSPSVVLGLVPAIAAVAAVALALGARSLAGRLSRRSMRTRIVAAADAVGEGVDEALSVLRS